MVFGGLVRVLDRVGLDFVGVCVCGGDMRSPFNLSVPSLIFSSRMSSYPLLNSSPQNSSHGPRNIYRIEDNDDDDLLVDPRPLPHNRMDIPP